MFHFFRHVPGVVDRLLHRSPVRDRSTLIFSLFSPEFPYSVAAHIVNVTWLAISSSPTAGGRLKTFVLTNFITVRAFLPTARPVHE